jgi:hypothetical protein
MTRRLRLRISIHGRLSTRLAAAFEGLGTVRRPGHTDLVGEVADQAQLHGVLGRVRDLGLAIDAVTVERVETGGSAGAGHGQRTRGRGVRPARIAGHDDDRR